MALNTSGSVEKKKSSGGFMSIFKGKKSDKSGGLSSQGTPTEEGQSER